MPRSIAEAEREILIVDGDHDEAIKREHSETIAAAIPHAGLLILPNASHFAPSAGPENNFKVAAFSEATRRAAEGYPSF